jgi:hypothetical protein
MKTLLNSLTDEVRGLIKRTERDFAPIVLEDFNDALRCSGNKIRTANQWLRVYYMSNGDYDDDTEAER